jgi:hypothetical protein
MERAATMEVEREREWHLWHSCFIKAGLDHELPTSAAVRNINKSRYSRRPAVDTSSPPGEAKNVDFIEGAAQADQEGCRRMAAGATAVSGDLFVLATSRAARKQRTVKAMTEVHPNHMSLLVFDRSAPS